MRQVFSSQRVETAEGVAALLRAAGIDVRLSNGRSYRSRRSGQFSYLDPVAAQAQPTVWVVHANDQPRARELLRGAGLLDSTRRDLEPGRAPYPSEFRSQIQDNAGKRWAWRIRIALLLAIGAMALATVLRHRAQQAPLAAPASAPAAPAAAAPSAPDDGEVRVRVQPAPRGN